MTEHELEMMRLDMAACEAMAEARRAIAGAYGLLFNKEASVMQNLAAAMVLEHRAERLAAAIAYDAVSKARWA